MGAVLRAERHQRRRLQLQPGELPEQRQKPAIRKRTRRVHLPRRCRLSFGQHRLEEAVAEPLAARRSRMGRERRWTDGGALLVRDWVRFPDRGAAQHQHAIATVGQPIPR